ncbi:protein of unknown function [Methanoculleus bourgensis]|uniref:Uncharacterized protein n=1 Tax=Methanoculleus bourgensis TaxID=83986 RepID=A0A0X3BR31_9EURY|nr:protein of unknown function [Methanoculleus bourgensis]
MAEFWELPPHLPHQDRLGLLADDGPPERLHGDLGKSARRASPRQHLPGLRLLQQPPDMVEHLRVQGSATLRSRPATAARSPRSATRPTSPGSPVSSSATSSSASRRSTSRWVSHPLAFFYAAGAVLTPIGMIGGLGCALGEVRDGSAGALRARGAVVSRVHDGDAVPAVCNAV